MRKSTDLVIRVSLDQGGLRTIKTPSMIDPNAGSEPKPSLMVILYPNMCSVSTLDQGHGIVYGRDTQTQSALYTLLRCILLYFEIKLNTIVFMQVLNRRMKYQQINRRLLYQ